jgi:hypothetical protein
MRSKRSRPRVQGQLDIFVSAPVSGCAAFGAGDGTEVVAPLRALPGLMAATMRVAFGEKAAPVNKRGQKTERIAADVHLSTSAVARQERRAQMTRSNRYS